MNTSVDVQISQRTLYTTNYDVVILGAGPYGLSTAAHLRESGLKVAVFGKPFQFWQNKMPRGMLLRSYWWATNLSDPHKQYRLEQFFQASGQKAFDPLPVETQRGSL
jgi:cation diffusion facilitator CzcD-associated flavoprotein CzcO